MRRHGKRDRLRYKTRRRLLADRTRPANRPIFPPQENLPVTPLAYRVDDPVIAQGKFRSSAKQLRRLPRIEAAHRDQRIGQLIIEIGNRSFGAGILFPYRGVFDRIPITLGSACSRTDRRESGMKRLPVHQPARTGVVKKKGVLFVTHLINNPTGSGVKQPPFSQLLNQQPERSATH